MVVGVEWRDKLKMKGINQQEFQIVSSIKNTKHDVVIENVCVGWDGGSQRRLLQRDNIEA